MEKAEAKGTQHSSQFEPKSESSPNKQLRSAQTGNHAKFINRAATLSRLVSQ